MSPCIMNAVVLAALLATPQVEMDVRAILEQATEVAAGVRPQDVLQLLTEIGSARAKNGDRCEAIDLFDRSLQALELLWDNKLEDRILFTYLVEARAKAGDFKGALETVDAIRVKAADTKASALAWVAMERADAGDFDEALQIVESIEAVQGDSQRQKMLISASRDLALHHIAVAQAGSEAGMSTMQTASRMRNERFRLRTLCEIAAAQAGAGNSADARKTLEQAVGMAKPARDQDQLWSIASTQVTLGDIKGALRTASSIPEGPEKGGALFDTRSPNKKPVTRMPQPGPLKKGFESSGRPTLVISATLFRRSQQDSQMREI